MNDYDQLVLSFQALECGEVVTTKEEFQEKYDELKKSERSRKNPKLVTVIVKASCGHLCETTYYNFAKKEVYVCNTCNIKAALKENFRVVKKKFEDLGVTLLTTDDEFTKNELRIGKDSFKVLMPLCSHERNIRYGDLKKLKKDLLYCSDCIKTKKFNGNLTYKEMSNRFALMGCTLNITEQEYKDGNYTVRSTYEVNAKCGHVLSCIPCNMTFKKKDLYCDDCAIKNILS
jgi:hypothetical protein